MTIPQKLPHDLEACAEFSENTAHFPKFFSCFILLCVVATLTFSGCSRQHYRQKADHEIYSLLKNGTKDPRWKLDDYSIKVDRQSRMYNPSNPDCEPIPQDDAAAHSKMLEVDGKKGSKHWNDNGRAKSVENPDWKQYLLLNEKGEVALDKEASVDLALLHSPEYQSALESLYLSAMRVSQERFRFDVQFFGGDSLFYAANGRLRDGSTSLTNDAFLEGTKLLATGGELVAGLANSITWTFNGQNTWHGDSLLNVGLVQPLLRGAGRKIALEDLTQSERDFLAAIRQMVFFQQGFYTKTITGQGRQAAPGGIGASNLPSFGGGFYGLLARQIQIQNLRQNIIGLEENLQRFQAIHEADQIDIFSVQETREGLLNAQSQLLTTISSYDSDVDTYLRSLGLPPDLKVDVKDPLMEQFQLTSLSLMDLQEEINVLLADIRKVDEPIPADFSDRLTDFMARTRSEMATLDNDMQVLERSVPERIKGLNSLESQLAEQIQRGERIDPSIYSEQIFLDRVAQLREQEIPENHEKLEAVFLLMELIVQTDHETLSQMIRDDAFSDEIKDALVLLKLDGESSTAENQRIEQMQLNVAESEKTLESLRALLQNEAASQESTVKSQYLDDAEQAKAIRDFLDMKESKQNQAPTDAQLLIADLQKVDPYRIWVRNILAEYQYEVSTLSILQTKSRLDAVTLVPTELDTESAFRIAEQNRLDWMNERAALVDQWRQIELTANQLRGDLTLTLDGEMGTIDKDGVRLNRENSRLRMGLAWDSPLTRHNEMLRYRESQIRYQAARRNYYTYVDAIKAMIRQLVRDIRVSQVDFEIKRNAIFVSATQLDSAQLALMEPAPRGTTIDTDTSRRLVSSLQSMLNSQNDFLNTWVDYQTVRMQLDLNMGTMQLDDKGRWIDPGVMSNDRQGPASGYRITTPSLTPRRAKSAEKTSHSAMNSVTSILEDNGGHAIPAAPRLPQLETKAIESILTPGASTAQEQKSAVRLAKPKEKMAKVAVKERAAKKSAFDLDTIPLPAMKPPITREDAPAPPKRAE